MTKSQREERYTLSALDGRDRFGGYQPVRPENVPDVPRATVRAPCALRSAVGLRAVHSRRRTTLHQSPMSQQPLQDTRPAPDPAGAPQTPDPRFFTVPQTGESGTPVPRPDPARGAEPQSIQFSRERADRHL